MQARLHLMSVLVDDQAKALTFYTENLGFVLKNDVPTGEYRWLTVVDSSSPDGVELLLEPDQHSAAQAFKTGLFADGIAVASFEVDDVDAAYAELSGKGVRFTQEPLDCGPVKTVVLDDTCGNLIQLLEYTP